MKQHLQKSNEACMDLEFAYLCEAPSFPETEAAFPLSPDLPLIKPMFPEAAFDFLIDAGSFPSGVFTSMSVFVSATP